MPSTNLHTPYSNGTTDFIASEMTYPFGELDSVLTRMRNPFVYSQGDIFWNKAEGKIGSLATIDIHFNRDAGTVCHNQILATEVAVEDGDFAYVTLQATEDATLTISTVTMPNNAASNFLAKEIFVLGKRKGSEFWGVNLQPSMYREKRRALAAKNIMVHCDDLVRWEDGTLYWDGTLHINFTRSDLQQCHNSIATSSLAVGDNQFAYAALNEISETEITLATATFASGSESTFANPANIVFGYRNASSDEFYPVHLHQPFADYRRQTIARLGSAAISATDLTKQTIYTVPTDKTMFVDHILFHSPTDSLASLNDMDVGGNATADDWLQELSLDAFTATADYGIVRQPEQTAGPPIIPVKKTKYAAAIDFGIKINKASTSSPTSFQAVIFGWLV